MPYSVACGLGHGNLSMVLCLLYGCYMIYTPFYCHFMPFLMMNESLDRISSLPMIWLLKFQRCWATAKETTLFVLRDDDAANRWVITKPHFVTAVTHGRRVDISNNDLPLSGRTSQTASMTKVSLLTVRTSISDITASVLPCQFLSRVFKISRISNRS